MQLRRLALGLLLGAVGCEGESLVQLQARIEVQPNPIVLPPTVIGLSSTARVTIKSTGSVGLSVSSVAIEGSDEWTLPQLGLPAVVDPGTELSFELTYRPTGAPLPTHLVVRSSAGDTPEVRVPIQAELKTGPAIAFCALLAGQAEVCTGDEATLVLAPLPAGQATTATVTVKSIGDTAATVEAVAFAASSDPAFSFPAITAPVTLEPGASVTRILRYQPTAAGAHRAILEARVSERSVDNPRLTFDGQALAPGALCATPTSLDFGQVVDGSSQDRNFELSACGGQPINLTQVALVGSGGAYTLIAAPSAQVLTPGGASVPVTVRFQPNGPGVYNGTIRAESDAGAVEVSVLGSVGGVGTLDCRSGATGFTWKDYLPARPVAVNPGPALGPSSGVAEATCTGDPTVATDPSTTESVSSVLAHNGGRWYFEVTVQQYEPGWSQVGAFATPSSAFQMTSPFTRTAGASLSPQGLDVISVAADLEAGRIYFYVNGVFDSEAEVLLLPGVGAFHGGGVAMAGNKLAFNFGQDAFSYALPTGYTAWAGGNAAAGACTSDQDQPAPPANVDVLCDGGARCGGATTFLSGARGTPELVVLGAYDTGSVSSWTWGTDAQGNPIEVPVGPGQNGSTLVEINRPGPVTLVLAAYEPTDWTIRVAAGTVLDSVHVYGMHLQTVAGLDAAVPLEIHTICTGGDGGNCPGFTGEQFPIAPYQWPYDTGGGDLQGFIDYIEERLCLPLKIYSGAYQVRRFTVN